MNQVLKHRHWQGDTAHDAICLCAAQKFSKVYVMRRSGDRLCMDT